MTCGTGTQWTRNICKTGVWGEPGCPNTSERTYRECHMPACDKGILKIGIKIKIINLDIKFGAFGTLAEEISSRRKSTIWELQSQDSRLQILKNMNII